MLKKRSLVTTRKNEENKEEDEAWNRVSKWLPWNHRSTRENYLRPVHTRSWNTHALPLFPIPGSIEFSRPLAALANHPANFAGATLVSRHRSLHTSRVSADRKRNEKVERANPGNRVTHRQKSDRKEREGGIATAMCPMRSDSPFSKRIRRVVIRNCLRIFHFCWIECA